MAISALTSDYDKTQQPLNAGRITKGVNKKPSYERTHFNLCLLNLKLYIPPQLQELSLIIQIKILRHEFPVRAGGRTFPMEGPFFLALSLLPGKTSSWHCSR